MNQDELTSPIQHILENIGSVELKIADALWPVLAQAWDDGFAAGYQHGRRGAGPSAPKLPNPYK